MEDQYRGNLAVTQQRLSRGLIVISECQATVSLLRTHPSPSAAVNRSVSAATSAFAAARVCRAAKAWMPPWSRGLNLAAIIAAIQQ